MSNPLEAKTRKTLVVNGKEYSYYSMKALGDSRYEKLPYCIRVLLESGLRNCNNTSIPEKVIELILDWSNTSQNDTEIVFKPARVILQDFTGVPAVVDLAAMRDAILRLGSDPNKINPHVPVDLVVDHSVQVDKFRSHDSLQRNLECEMYRNKERFIFLKWGAQTFKNLTIVPPGAGIVHQVNLEYLARVVFNKDNVLYFDSLVGTDSHTPMVNGLGVVGWGVGGIEAEAVMLGQPISLVLPEVVGFKIDGVLSDKATSTDLVLVIVNILRKFGVVDKFVEFFGPGIANLSIADRATISNMSPEMGCTISFFSIDDVALQYMRDTGRSDDHIAITEAYFKAQDLFRDYASESNYPNYTKIIELDLADVIPALSGPKRPHDYVPLKDVKYDFLKALQSPAGFKGFNIKTEDHSKSVTFSYEGKQYSLSHGSVVIAAITSCTNTSNPMVMIGAGLLAKRAVEAGLTVNPYIKTSLAPGSGVVTLYLQKSGLIKYLEALGFYTVGYGCTTCIGNSGPLPDEVGKAIEDGDLVAAGVLSGNRNFEGRIHPLVRANYLASPPLVVAYALAGTLSIDFDKEPIGHTSSGKPVYLNEIFPTHQDILELTSGNVLKEMFIETYKKVTQGTETWNNLVAPVSELYEWDENSTYIHNPPFFSTMSRELTYDTKITNARVLLYLGDSITTDHISPAGSISKTSPAGRFLMERGVDPGDFNSYGARRGNDQIMARGTFANIRLINKFMDKPGPKTLHLPTNETCDIFTAAQRYMQDGTQLIILAGEQYGSGSSRDWAAKGSWMLGVKAVIAQSYERIHRSNLVLFGVIPLQFMDGESAQSLGLTGKELYNIDFGSFEVNKHVVVNVEGGNISSFNAILKFNTETEILYFKHGGVLNYVIRQTLGN